MFVDLDQFKVVDDTLGHRGGDDLLVAVAERLLHCMRPAGTVARIGGDEFVIITPDTSTVQEAVAVATRVADCLRTPVSVNGTATLTSASIGIVIAERGQDPEHAIANADLVSCAGSSL